MSGEAQAIDLAGVALLLPLGGAVLVLWRCSSRTERATGRAGPVALQPLAVAATVLVLVLVLVMVDLRMQWLDPIPDSVGWAMAAVALGSLRTVHQSSQVAAIAASLAVLPSLRSGPGRRGL